LNPADGVLPNDEFNRMKVTMRHIIVHYHIFKNAGSTIDVILQNRFAGLWGSIEGSYPWDTLSRDAILQYALAHPTLKAISSHHARLPVPDDSNLVFYPLIFLRHPIDRLGSVYSFERREPKDSASLGVKIARENDFAGYVKWRLSEGNGAVIKNFQTIHISGREKDMRTAAASDSDLKDAMERISHLPFFGIVELFDDSIARMKSYLAPHIGQIDTNYAVVNRSPERKTTLQERLDEIEDALGKSLYQEVLDKNALDLQLYDSALKLFELQGADRGSSQNAH
jgi:hypothetical protein